MTSLNARPTEIGSDKQLFIDQRFIESSYGVKLCMNPPVKADPVLVAETPVEGHRIGVFSTVIEADGRYLMYYDATLTFAKVAGPDGAITYGQVICLAVSDDGISWQRENVGLHEVCGSRDNNVVLPGCTSFGRSGSTSDRSAHTVRLRIRMRAAKLYAFQFVGES